MAIILQSMNSLVELKKFQHLLWDNSKNISIIFLLKRKVIQINSSVPFLKNPCPWFVSVNHELIEVLLIWI